MRTRSLLIMLSVTKPRSSLRHPISPYVGSVLRGRVRMTVLRGQVVYDGMGFPGKGEGEGESERERMFGRTLRGRARGARTAASAGAAGRSA